MARPPAGVAGHGQGPPQRGYGLRPRQPTRAADHGQPTARQWLAYEAAAYKGGRLQEHPQWWRPWRCHLATCGHNAGRKGSSARPLIGRLPTSKVAVACTGAAAL
ncbi:hypothetical protein B296_00014464 [Ensete ventricosum]|uniref:Uncharacterized protein n=1 Tax=Ensete ventricosum TaxID=4639 RepID=A0A427AVZ4_ENSVE|nr:hypothetical protein B296_00014464 [Ensete ventricosum]